MDSMEEKSTSAPEAASKKDLQEHPHIKKVMSLESLVFFIIVAALFGLLGTRMGAINMINTMMQTAYQLLLDTVFYIMAIAVLAGALSGLFTEFGIVAIINKILSPLMKPVYDLPGASVVGILATYLSDNPAILTLAEDQGFRRYFKRYQLPALTNIGTAFGMGLIITSFMVGILSPSGESFVVPALIGNLGAIIGSVVSVRLMLMFTAKVYGKTEDCEVEGINAIMYTDYRMVRPGNVGTRFLSAMLDGGKSGVEMGMAIIPGVLVICTLCDDADQRCPPADGAYTGGAYEGIALLPAISRQAGVSCSSLSSAFPAAGRISPCRSRPWAPREQPWAWCRRLVQSGQARLQRYRRFYGHVYVLERISEHPRRR